MPARHDCHPNDAVPHTTLSYSRNQHDDIPRTSLTLASHHRLTLSQHHASPARKACLQSLLFPAKLGATQLYFGRR
jgi:hypothetical protein